MGDWQLRLGLTRNWDLRLAVDGWLGICLGTKQSRSAHVAGSHDDAFPGRVPAWRRKGLLHVGLYFCISVDMGFGRS